MRHRENRQVRHTRVFQLLHRSRAVVREEHARNESLAEQMRAEEESARQEERLKQLEILYGGDTNSYYAESGWLQNYARRFQRDLLAERDEIIQEYFAFCTNPYFAFLSFRRPDICARACWKRRALAFAELEMVRRRKESAQEYHRRKRQRILDVLLETAETKATIDQWIEEQIANIADNDEKDQARQQFQGIAGSIIDDMNQRDEKEKRSSSPAAPEEVASEEEADEEVY